MSRPTSWSTWAVNPAKTSICRAIICCCSGVNESQAGISSGRGVSSASWGMTPSSFWRAKVSSRYCSYPASNWPLNGSLHSAGTWCGAWVAPGQK